MYAVRAREHAFEVVPVVGLCLPAAKFYLQSVPRGRYLALGLGLWLMFGLCLGLVSCWFQRKVMVIIKVAMTLGFGGLGLGL